MKKLGIGILLVALGLPGTAYFFSDLVTILMGALPVLLILGGGLAVYLGYEDIQAEKDFGADTQPPSQPPSEDAGAKQEPEGLTGNTDTLVFHSLSCNFAQGKNCTATFRDRDDAISQGYKPCKICNP